MKVLDFNDVGVYIHRGRQIPLLISKKYLHSVIKDTGKKYRGIYSMLRKNRTQIISHFDSLPVKATSNG